MLDLMRLGDELENVAYEIRLAIWFYCGLLGIPCREVKEVLMWCGCYRTLKDVRVEENLTYVECW